MQMKVDMNQRVAVWGPRRMVRRALSRTSYRHAGNYSPHFFPVLPSGGRGTTRVQLWWLFRLRLTFSMFGDVLVCSFMAPLPSGSCQSQNLCVCLVFVSRLPISICHCDVPGSTVVLCEDLKLSHFSIPLSVEVSVGGMWPSPGGLR